MSFDPAAHGCGIVHIGPGAFHRAHQAVYTQDSMQAKGGDWRIIAVSPRSTDVADALRAQNGRYTLVTRGAQKSSYRVIESLSDAISASRDPDAVLAALSRPETQIVSLTITEKAYDPESSAIRLLASALAQRMAAGTQPFTLMSCDNLPGNGAVLREVVMDAALDTSTKLAEWTDENVRFPSTMVDRITPATTADLLKEVARETGWADQVPVETEAFSQWVIEDNFGTGRPAWDVAGAQLVSSVAPYEKMKLRMLNGAHSMLAYAGHLAGKTYVRDVMAEPVLAAQVERHMTAAALTLTSAAGLDANAYRDALLARFRNPAIAHETYQIAMDGSQKMPQRIFAPALEAAEKGMELAPFAFATAAWAQYLAGRTEAGDTFELRDPREAELAALPAAPDDRIDAIFSLPDLVPAALAHQDRFRKASKQALRAIQGYGILAALREDADA